MAKKKILIIDDEKDLTQMIKMNLEQAGQFQVKVENSARNVVPVAEVFQPNLIFMDVIMPEMSGGEVAQNLKDNESTKNIPIVFLTATILKEEVSREGTLIGGRPFLAKPADINEILECIKKYATE